MPWTLKYNICWSPVVLFSSANGDSAVESSSDEGEGGESMVGVEDEGGDGDTSENGDSSDSDDDDDKFSGFNPFGLNDG